jgi:putative ABC transport system substrate-binding protein
LFTALSERVLGNLFPDSALRELGWVEGRNLVIEDRRSMNVEQLHSLATELVHLKVDLIYASGTPATRAARQATSSIPIVMIVGVDPVSDGLVASLPRPGGNVTGITTIGAELIGKRLGLLREVIPGISRIAFMWNPANPGNVSASEEIARVAPTMGVKIQSVPVRDPNEFDSAFARIRNGRADALYIGADGMLVAHAARLAELAVKHHVPTMHAFRAHAAAGGLLVYAADLTALYRRAATYVDKILKGEKPGDLPVEQPTKFELIINLKTAKALGLTIPPSLLARADQVIE